MNFCNLGYSAQMQEFNFFLPPVCLIWISHEWIWSLHMKSACESVYGSGFINSYDTSLFEWSWITDADPDHPTGSSQPPFLWWDCLICTVCVFLQFAVAFCGLGFISLYLAGKLHCFQAQGRGQGWKLCIALAPVIVAMALALTRYSDYRHHWQGILDDSEVTITGFVDSSFVIYTRKSDKWKLLEAVKK